MAETEAGLQGSENVARAALASGGAHPDNGGDPAVRRRRVRTPAQESMHQALGRALKAHYEDLASAPLPDRLLVLLAELEAKEAASSRGLGQDALDGEGLIRGA